MTHPVVGLSEGQVVERRKQGQGNQARYESGRTYLQILRKNAFTFINTVLFSIGFVLILMGQMGDAFVTAGLVLANVVFGVYQEARAKRKLDQIALLTRPKATVIRGGQEQNVDPSEIVLGDALVARPGDQIVADGQVLGDGRMEVDESLLSGESERVLKTSGDKVYSGSYCVAGSALYEAQKVGADSLVNQLTAGARAFRLVKTPLQRDIDYIIRILVLVVTQLGILLGISFVIEGLPLVEGVKVAAVIVALVPQGLFFMTTVAYAMGALRVAGKGALIQEANAVESTSHVNLLCLDKTGTLTTNRIELEAVHRLGHGESMSEAELRRILACYAASVAGGTQTTSALREALGGEAVPVREEAAFSSDHKWSGMAFGESDLPGAYVLGAPEVLAPNLADGGGLDRLVDERTRQGLRVLLFAYNDGEPRLLDTEGRPQLPRDLRSLALLSFRDELRAEAGETLRHFAELGIEPKIISGDNPQTVASLARQVGLENLRTVSGLEMQGLSQAQLAELAGRTTVFGRIAPQQKETLVRLFRQMGYYVAMIGDGVNDVLSLKQAQLGVAMQSGSPASRDVADIVLLGDSFGALPIAFREGQRIVRGMEDVVRLLLTRTLYVLLLIIATQIVGVPFPVTPKHNSILALLTVGIPIVAIAAWARPGPPPRSIARSASHFVLPAAFTISIVALATYLGYWGMSEDVQIARSALTTVTVLCGLLMIPFVEPPSQRWVAGDELSGDPRPTLLALGMLFLYAVVTALPALRGFFELSLLGAGDYALLVGVAVVWALVMRFVWRARVLERLLALDGA